MSRNNTVSWFELPADDMQRATTFYGTVFGWRTPPMGPGAAFALTVAADDNGDPTEVGGINGGFHQRHGDTDRSPVVNISVDDVDATLASVVASGGSVVQPRTDLPDFGLTMALFADPEGNVLGVYCALGRD